MTKASDAAPTRRGRPVGSRTRVLKPVQALGAHHFAFLRATLQGLDTRTAWRRYLSFSEDEVLDLRRLEQRRRAMLTDLMAMAAAVGWRQPNDHPVNQARLLLAPWVDGLMLARSRVPSPVSNAATAPVAVASAPAVLSARALPSLDEFIEASGLDPDTYSQAEWLALYREQHGLLQEAVPQRAVAIEAEAGTPALDRRAIAERVRALGVLEQVVGRSPQAQDELSLWLASPTCRRLHACGWQRLADLSRAVLAHGAGWWQAVPGLGQVRARAIEHWLVDLHRTWNRPFPAQALEPRQLARRRWLGRSAPSATRGSVAVPPPDRWPSVFEPLPAGLRAPGSGPSAQASAAPAFDAAARERILAWLNQHRDQAATWRAYRKEAERLWWWCAGVRRCELAALGPADLEAFSHFLQEPPADWLCSTPLPRSDPDWRPFRRKLSAGSADQAMRVIRSLLADAYPAVERSGPRGSKASVSSTPSPIGAHRAPSPPRTVGATALDHRPDWRGTPARRRALLLGVVSLMGCSAEEALQLSVKAVDGQSAWVLQRPDLTHHSIGPALQALAQAHLRDVGAAMPTESAAPLFHALRGGVRRWQVREGDVALEPWPRPAKARPWSVSGYRRSLAR